MNTRQQKILKELRLAQEPLTSSEIGSLLQVSSKTIRNDVKELNEQLESYDAYVSSTRGKGYQLIIQNERLFQQFIQSQHDPQDDIPSNHQERVSYLMEKLLMSSDYNKIEDLADELYISRSTLQHELKHIREILKKYDLALDQKPYHGIKVMKKEFLVAKEMAKEIQEKLNVSFTNHEVAYLAIHLQGTKLSNSCTHNMEAYSVIDSDIQEMVKEMIKRIDDEYGFHLTNDEELLLAMSLHLKPAINRYKFKMNIRNPMLDEIKSKYPLSFDAALIGAQLVQEKINITIDENEIGYLALHIEVAQERQKRNKKMAPRCLIVCASGLGSAQLLMFKLQSEFGDQLNIIGTTEYYNLLQQSFQNIDFIISTIPIEEKLTVPVISSFVSKSF